MTGRRGVGIVLLAAAAALDAGSAALSQATKVPGLVEEGHYDPGTRAALMPPAPQNDDTGSIYAVGPWPTYTPPLADGEGRELVQSFCGICHSTTYITMQPPLPSATWEVLVHKMIGTFGAPIPEPSAQAIIAYLKNHYTPETRKE
jgi:hypothetical protein